MSNIDTNASGTQKNGLGAKTDGLVNKTDGLVKQAQDLGRDLKGQASEFTQKATETVKSQAGNLTEQAKEVASDAGEKLLTAVSDQKAAGADYVGNVANIIRRTAYEFDTDMPQAGHYIRKAAAQIENVSEAMRNKNMSEIVGNVQDFARKQPTAFFGAAVLVGFAAVRFLKSGSSDTAVAAVRPTTQTNVGGTTAGM
jgi:gas vesicle protein